MKKFNFILHAVCLSYVYMILDLAASCPEDCVCTDAVSVECTKTIPVTLSELTRSVIIVNPPKNITKRTFAGGGWGQIEDLSLTSDSSKVEDTQFNGAIYIGPEAFSGIVSLRSLSITNFESFDYSFDILSFKGIEGLKRLNMEDSSIFRPDLVFAAIKSSLHNVEVLNLANLGALNRYTFDLEDEALDAMRATKVKFLDISGMNIGSVNRYKFANSFPYLQSLTMKRLKLNTLISLLAVYLDETINFNNCKLPGTLQKLDASDLAYRIRITYSSTSVFRLGKCLSDLKELYLNNVVDQVSIYGVQFLSEPLEDFGLEKLELMNNGLQKVNFSFLHTGKCLSLKQVNLANNNISYLAPSFMQRLENVAVLNLTNNVLGHMEGTNDFLKLFINNSNLEILSLAGNSLSNIPRLFFIGNNNLHSIDLSSNNLMKISFQVSHLIRLQHLDIRNNKIAVLNVDVLAKLESLRLNQRQFPNNGTALKISTSFNPFVCTCNPEGFPQIIDQYVALFDLSGISTTVCDFEGTQFRLFTASTKRNINEKCRQKTIIVISCASIVFCLTVGAALMTTVYRLVRRIRKKRHLLRLIELYANKDVEHQFLVFLSYSSEDCNFVDTYVYEQLEQKLKDILNVENNIELICNGDLHFQAGRRIEDEIVKCVESSKVVLLLISKAFCSSPWCDYETMVSYYEKKPIILMFKEDVPTKTMPSVLRKLFHRYVRATCKDVNGTMVMNPGWDRLCEAIVEQADV